MPRLSIYKPEKGNDYKFFDRTIKDKCKTEGHNMNIWTKILGAFLKLKAPTQQTASGSSIANGTTVPSWTNVHEQSAHRRTHAGFGQKIPK